VHDDADAAWGAAQQSSGGNLTAADMKTLPSSQGAFSKAVQEAGSKAMRDLSNVM